MLGREEQRQSTISRGADQLQHAWTHRADVDGDLPRRKSEVRLRCPVFQEVTGRMTSITVEQSAQGGDCFCYRGYGSLRAQPNPAEKVVGSARDAEQRASTAQFVQRRRGHRDFSWMLGKRIDDARAQLDTLSFSCDRRKDDPYVAQEQVVADPEGVEADLLGFPG